GPLAEVASGLRAALVQPLAGAAAEDVSRQGLLRRRRAVRAPGWRRRRRRRRRR
ncbi:unnamed protein product, partial [Prorocentrum cordatum]